MDQIEVLKEVVETLKDIQKELKAISTSLKKSEPLTLTATYKEVETKKIEEVKADVAKAEIKPESKYPVPTDFREAIESILNKEFKVEVEPLSDQPAFQLSILVPKHYSNMPPSQLNLTGEDRRSRVVSYADGVNGARAWAEKVYDNLPAETKAAIVQARQQVKV